MRMPIVLGTFTSSPTKFVDLSYYKQSCRNSMKALQPLVVKNGRRSSLICCSGKLNNECSTLLFSPSSSFISQNRTLGTRGFSRVQREFSVLAEGRHIFKDLTETGNRARKVSGTQGSKIANMRIFHSERSNSENTYTLLYFANFRKFQPLS